MSPRLIWRSRPWDEAASADASAHVWSGASTALTPVGFTQPNPLLNRLQEVGVIGAVWSVASAVVLRYVG